jgi:hypothetical protein
LFRPSQNVPVDAVDSEAAAATPDSETLVTPLSRPYQHGYFDEPTHGDGYDEIYGTTVHANNRRTVPTPHTASGRSWDCNELVEEPAIIVSVPWVRHVWHLLFDLVQPMFNMVRRTYGAHQESSFFGGADPSEERDLRIWLYHRQERDSDSLPEEREEHQEKSNKSRYLHIERELELAVSHDRPPRVLRLMSRLPFGTKEDLDAAGLVCFRDLHVGLDPRGTPFAFGVQRIPSEATVLPNDMATAAPTSPVGKMVEEQLAFKRFLERGLGLIWGRSTSTDESGGSVHDEKERAARLFGELDGLSPDEEEAKEEELRAQRLFGDATEGHLIDEGEEGQEEETARSARLFGDIQRQDDEEEDQVVVGNNRTLRKELITVIRRAGGDGVRSLTNHGELIAALGTMALETANFATMGAQATVQEAVLESMSFGKQLKVFQDTTILFGVHGQALSNTIFLRDGAVLILVNEPTKFGLKWMFANLALTSRVHVVAIRRPEDSCDDSAGWGGLKDHVTFNRNKKNGTTLETDLFSLAIKKAMELRELPFNDTSVPSLHIIPEGGRCG